MPYQIQFYEFAIVLEREYEPPSTAPTTTCDLGVWSSVRVGMKREE